MGQYQVMGRINTHLINPLSPHDALMHYFTSLKTDFFPQQGFKNEHFHETDLPIHGNFIIFFKPHLIIFIHYKSSNATAIRGL